MIKYYIATGLPRAKEHNDLREKLDGRGFQITYDWTTHGSVKFTDVDTLNRVAQAEIDGVLAAEIVIVLLPGGQGTHIELGAALASGKLLIVHSEHPGHFLPGSDTCAFYHHSRIIRAGCSLSQLPDFIASASAHLREPVESLSGKG